MRLFFFRHLVFGLCALAILSLFFVYRQTQGSQILEKRKQLEQYQPDVVLIGNSLLRAGVDQEKLSHKVECRALKVYSNGSASAWWYLYVKNVLCQASQKSKIAVIFFRDHFLTEPCFRIDGEYSKPIRTLSEKEEPLLQEVLTKGGASSARLWASPLTWVPQEAKESLERRLYKTTAKLWKVDKEKPKEIMQQVFDEKNMAKELLSKQQLQSEEAAEEGYNFSQKASCSFLPHIIAELKKKDILPVFVRLKRRRDVEGKIEPEQLRVYVQHLKSYLEGEGVRFLDFTYDPRIAQHHFGPGDHLNEEGKIVFTEILAETLKNLDVSKNRF